MHLNFEYGTIILTRLYSKYYMEYIQQVIHYSSEIHTEHGCPVLSNAVDDKATIHPDLWAQEVSLNVQNWSRMVSFLLAKS